VKCGGSTVLSATAMQRALDADHAANGSGGAAGGGSANAWWKTPFATKWCCSKMDHVLYEEAVKVCIPL